MSAPDAWRTPRTVWTALLVGLIVVGGVRLYTRLTCEQYAPQAPPRLDLNLASLDDLTTLPGVGPTLAQRIVDARRDGGKFATAAELVARVEGIGEHRLALLLDYAFVEQGEAVASSTAGEEAKARDPRIP